ncbi:hypothetical protein EMCRGX_G022370 [Ephydatia muelleri]
MNFVRSLHGAAVVSRRPLIKFPQRYPAEEKPVAKVSPVVEPPAKPAQEIIRPKPQTGKTVVLSSSYGRRLPSQEEIFAINMGGNR